MCVVQETHALPQPNITRPQWEKGDLRIVIGSTGFYFGVRSLATLGLGSTVGVLRVGGVWRQILRLNSVFGSVGACQVDCLR